MILKKISKQKRKRQTKLHSHLKLSLHNKEIPCKSSHIHPTIKSKARGSDKITSTRDLKWLHNKQTHLQNHKQCQLPESINIHKGNQEQYGNGYPRIGLQKQSQSSLKHSRTKGTSLKEQSQRSGFQNLLYTLKATTVAIP